MPRPKESISSTTKVSTEQIGYTSAPNDASLSFGSNRRYGSMKSGSCRLSHSYREDHSRIGERSAVRQSAVLVSRQRLGTGEQP
jgi:hypothetical protein